MTPNAVTECLPELYQIEYLIAQRPKDLAVDVLCEIPYLSQQIPIYSLSLGSESADAPCVVYVGGIHGLERIGTRVVLTFLGSLLERLRWDMALAAMLERMRIVFLPLINPAGMAARRRANGHGVDLMRNAPVDSSETVTWLVGGHRLSPHLPWYRGAKNAGMEKEARCLCDYIIDKVLPAPFSLVLDCHSGFGYRDRIWFPYASSSRKPIRHIGQIYHLRELFFQTYPNQNYLFEPQAQHYVTHGDLWDYLYDIAAADNRTFLPLTLEMGSWLWIRKNPRQLFQLLGMFHPIKPHRVKRVLRRHLVLMEFLLHATFSYQKWLEDSQRFNMAARAHDLWYGAKN